MSPILALLNEMRGRLGMYVGETSLKKLAAFLRGYDYALEKHTGRLDPFLGAFRDWVHRRFQSSALSWENVLLRRSTDETQAVELFWRLLDEYLEEQESTTPNGPQGAAASSSTHVPA
jgi:hypothetical protein